MYNYLCNKTKPYKNAEFNNLDVNTCLICIITIFVGIFLYKNKFDYFVYSGLSFIVMINAWFILVLLKKLISSFSD